MAIYHLHVQVISRGKGHSATHTAARCTGSIIHDLRTGRTYDFTDKAGGVVLSFISLPQGAAAGFLDRSVLWNGAEAAERRYNGRTAREIDVALAHELSTEAQERTLRRMALFLNERYRVAVEVSVHLPDPMADQRNDYAIMMFTTREVTPDGFGKKTLALDRGEQRVAEFKLIRKEWETIVNSELEAAGLSVRISSESNEARGINRPRAVHEGARATHIRRRKELLRREKTITG